MDDLDDYDLSKRVKILKIRYKGKGNIYTIARNGFVISPDKKLYCVCCKSVLSTLEPLTFTHNNPCIFESKFNILHSISYPKHIDYVSKEKRYKSFKGNILKDIDDSIKKYFIDFVFFKDGLVFCYVCGNSIDLSTFFLNLRVNRDCLSYFPHDINCDYYNNNAEINQYEIKTDSRFFEPNIRSATMLNLDSVTPGEISFLIKNISNSGIYKYSGCLLKCFNCDLKTVIPSDFFNNENTELIGEFSSFIIYHHRDKMENCKIIKSFFKKVFNPSYSDFYLRLITINTVFKLDNYHLLLDLVDNNFYLDNLPTTSKAVCYKCGFKASINKTNFSKEDYDLIQRSHNIENESCLKTKRNKHISFTDYKDIIKSILEKDDDMSYINKIMKNEDIYTLIYSMLVKFKSNTSNKLLLYYIIKNNKYSFLSFIENLKVKEIREKIEDLGCKEITLSEFIENNKINEEKLNCVVCLNERNEYVLSCGHQICGTCFKRLEEIKDNKCPYCRVIIASKTKIFNV